VSTLEYMRRREEVQRLRLAKERNESMDYHCNFLHRLHHIIDDGLGFALTAFKESLQDQIDRKGFTLPKKPQ
jgi:hypothetical protein